RPSVSAHGIMLSGTATDGAFDADFPGNRPREPAEGLLSMLGRDDLLPLKKTPLHGLHVSLGAKIVPFAGYDMPVQYPAGVLREHLHTRNAAELFDVSHMGQIALTARSGRLADAAAALEAIVPQDILGLPRGRQRYAQFTNADG